MSTQHLFSCMCLLTFQCIVFLGLVAAREFVVASCPSIVLFVSLVCIVYGCEVWCSLHLRCVEGFVDKVAAIMKMKAAAFVYVSSRPVMCRCCSASGASLWYSVAFVR